MPTRAGEPGDASREETSKRERETNRDPFVRRATSVVLIIVATALLLTLLVLGIDVVLAAFAGLLIAVLLHALMALVQRLVAMPDGWALTVVTVVLLTVVGLAGWLLTPQIVEQTANLGEQLAAAGDKIEGFLDARRWGRWLLSRARAEGGFPAGLGGVLGGAFTALSDWATYLLIAVFVGWFVAANTALYKNGVVQLFPLRRRAVIRELLDELGQTLRWFLIGQLITMTIIGVSVMIVLWAFGIRLAIVIGLLVGLLGFIPYLGPFLGAVPVILITLPEGPMMMLYVMLAYTGVQLLEGYVAAPLIQQRTVYLPPAFTIVMQVLLGTVLGLLGFVLATPLAAVALVLARSYRREILRDPEVEDRD
ncbi:MAG: AI-2E family transporter [Enhygromyxa sp.]